MKVTWNGSPESYEKHKARLRLRYAENPNKFKKRSQNYRESHPKWKKEYDKKYRESKPHKEKQKKDHKNWRIKNDDYNKEHKRISFQQILSDPHKKLRLYKKRKETRDQLKFDVTLHYSKLKSKQPNCVCCGETNMNMLTIGSINGSHSKKIKKYGQDFYYWLRRNWPSRINWRTECWNCNTGKQIAGSKTCPHKLKK